MFPYTDQGQRDMRKKTYVRKFQEIPLHKSFLRSSWEKGQVLFFKKGLVTSNPPNAAAFLERYERHCIYEDMSCWQAKHSCQTCPLVVGISSCHGDQLQVHWPASSVNIAHWQIGNILVISVWFWLDYFMYSIKCILRVLVIKIICSSNGRTSEIGLSCHHGHLCAGVQRRVVRKPFMARLRHASRICSGS